MYHRPRHRSEFRPKPYDTQYHGRKHSFKPSAPFDGDLLKPCFYCGLPVPFLFEVRHLARNHLDLQFHCLLCPSVVAFPFFGELMTHLESIHDVEGNLPPSDIVQRKLGRLPVDLRGLKCRMCVDPPRYYLAQDRANLASHIRRRHGIKVDRKDLKYVCRVCYEEFADSEAVIRDHKCARLTEQQIGFQVKQIDESFETRYDLKQCLYCTEMYPSDERASHMSFHWMMEFHCDICPRSFSFFEDIKKHLEKDHHKQSGATVAKDLSDRGLIKMPKDLRMLYCPECPEEKRQWFLAQNRTVLLKHLQEEHEGRCPSINKILYGCRSCQQTSFESVEVFREHPCANKDTMSNIPNFDLARIEALETPETTGDLRVLVCRMCGKQANGVKFLKMAKHLDAVHRKDAEDKTICVEKLVAFGCAHCVDFQCFSTIHQWDIHFRNDYQSCLKIDGEKDRNKLDNQSDDIRRVGCTACGHQIPGDAVEDMTEHWKIAHPNKEICIDLRCAKCPEFKTMSIVEWQEHFYKSFKACKLSYNKEFKEKLKSKEMSSSDNEEEEAAPDLRKLCCRICDFHSEGSSFSAMVKHLQEFHMLQEDHEERTVFTCQNCPNFLPSSVIVWDRHFSKSFRQCQGSRRIRSKDNRHFSWCDSCMETREDIDKHFSGERHRFFMKKIKASETYAGFHCDVCKIDVLTEANYSLHLRGISHRRKAVVAVEVVQDQEGENE